MLLEFGRTLVAAINDPSRMLDLLQKGNYTEVVRTLTVRAIANTTEVLSRDASGMRAIQANEIVHPVIANFYREAKVELPVEMHGRDEYIGSMGSLLKDLSKRANQKFTKAVTDGFNDTGEAGYRVMDKMDQVRAMTREGAILSCMRATASLASTLRDQVQHRRADGYAGVLPTTFRECIALAEFLGNPDAAEAVQQIYNTYEVFDRIASKRSLLDGHASIVSTYVCIPGLDNPGVS
jgi:hypothetical protein